MNKYFFALILLLACATIATAQSKPALPYAYVYSRQVISGLNPSLPAPHENGDMHTREAKPALQYYIYIESTYAPQIKAVWLQGKFFAVTQQKITTPIIIQNNSLPGNTADTLVPATKNSVWQLQIKEQKTDSSKLSTLTQQIIKKNEVVIVYTYKAKTQMLAKKQIKKLSDISLQ